MYFVSPFCPLHTRFPFTPASVSASYSSLGFVTFWCAPTSHRKRSAKVRRVY